MRSDELSNLLPIDASPRLPLSGASHIQANRYPALGPQSGRHVGANRVQPNQKVLVAGMGLTTYGDAAIAMSNAMTAPLLLPKTNADVSPVARRTATASRLCWLISKFWRSFIVLRELARRWLSTFIGRWSCLRIDETTLRAAPMLAMLHQGVGHGREAGNVHEQAGRSKRPQGAAGGVLLQDEIRDEAVYR